MENTTPNTNNFLNWVEIKNFCFYSANRTIASGNQGLNHLIRIGICTDWVA